MNEHVTENQYQATYDPTDNKLRLYSLYRLDAETYSRVKAAGFSWAPKQELFVAPAWTPEREDLLLELAGDIGDEESTLNDRASARADRFDGYSEKRKADAEQAENYVSRIADGIPLGQPILVGHHSERKARRDQRRIQQGMSRAVENWRTAAYWLERAHGAIRNAKYKERVDVRARRVKTLEADMRRQNRDIERASAIINLWQKSNPLTMERAVKIAGIDYQGVEIDGHVQPLYSAIKDGKINLECVQTIAVENQNKIITRATRWVTHIENRLVFERALLSESGYKEPAKTKSLSQTLPLLNYEAETVDIVSPYSRETKALPVLRMTKAEYAKIYTDYKGTHFSADRSHRIRCALVSENGKGYARTLCAVFLTDSKVHSVPTRSNTTQNEEPPQAFRPVRTVAPTPERIKEAREIMDRANTIKATEVKPIVAPTLFPTPKIVAQEVAVLASILPGHKVLEPSAGTGALIEAIGEGFDVKAVEISFELSQNLRQKGVDVDTADFLSWTPPHRFDRIVMNPPFDQAVDIQHISRAVSFLAPGGRLVAICADGPRQRSAFQGVASVYRPLPPGSFAATGTNVNAAIVVIEVGE